MPPPSPDPAELDRLRRQYVEFSTELGELGSPLYAALCGRLAADGDIGPLPLLARPGFRTPLILLAAVHHLLLAGVQHPLAAYYPSVAGVGARPIDDELFPAFADLVAGRRAEVERLVRERTTQTNEAGRTILTYPALALVGRESGAPLALLEVGASAGLNLHPDRFRYRIGDRQVGAREAEVEVACEVEGDLRPPTGEGRLAVAWRRGLDLNPLDVRDPATREWLRALVWPEHADRLAILDGALSIARRDPAPVERGDLLHDLPRVAQRAPRDSALTVLSTWVLAYVAAERRPELVATLARIAADRDRPVWLVACEAQAVLAGLEVGLAQPPADGTGGPSLLSLHRFDPAGGSVHALLARCQPHGRWIRWLDPATATAA